MTDDPRVLRYLRDLTKDESSIAKLIARALIRAYMAGEKQSLYNPTIAAEALVIDLSLIQKE